LVSLFYFPTVPKNISTLASLHFCANPNTDRPLSVIMHLEKGSMVKLLTIILMTSFCALESPIYLYAYFFKKKLK